MEIILNETIYAKSLDPNIIYQYRLNKQEIHIDKLETQISNLQSSIDNNPKVKQAPIDATIDVKEAIDFWNDSNSFNVSDLMEQKTDKESLLDKIKSVNEVK